MNVVHETFRRLVRHAELNSPDLSTKNAAVVRTAHGIWSAFGVNKPCVPYTPADLLDREWKMARVVHAEEDAIDKCHDPVYGEMFAVWAPCPGCARAIIRAGIAQLTTLAALDRMCPDRWKSQVELGRQILKEGGVRLVLFDEPLGEELTFDGMKVGL